MDDSRRRERATKNEIRAKLSDGTPRVSRWLDSPRRKKLRRPAFARTPRCRRHARARDARRAPRHLYHPRARAPRAFRAIRARARRVPVARASHESWYRERDNPFYSSDSVDDSYDGEAYPLSSQTAPFTEPFTTASRPGSWTSPTPTRGDPAGVPRWDAGDARTPSTWTHTSAHARHPHTVSIKLPRPVSKHLAFAPRRLPAARTYDVELQVRPRDPRNRDRDRSLREKRHRLARSRGENHTQTRTFPHTPAPHLPLLLPHTLLLGRDPVRG